MLKSDQTPRLLTMNETAQRLGVSARFIRNAVHNRSISVIRVGSLIRFQPTDVDAYLAARRLPAVPTVHEQSHTNPAGA